MEITIFSRCIKTVLMEAEFVIQNEMAAVGSVRHIFHSTST